MVGWQEEFIRDTEADVSNFGTYATGSSDVEATDEFDNSDFCVACAITDNRSCTITVKMGKPTDGEMLAELMEVLNNEEV